jgi:hypothetical protein
MSIVESIVLEKVKVKLRKQKVAGFKLIGGKTVFRYDELVAETVRNGTTHVLSVSLLYRTVSHLFGIRKTLPRSVKPANLPLFHNLPFVNNLPFVTPAQHDTSRANS